MARPRTTLTYHWLEPDATITRQKLIGLADELEDFTKPMAAAAIITREDIQDRFRTGSDAEGTKWDDWAESYEPWVLPRTTGPIFGDRANLHLSGKLEKAVMRKANFKVTNEGLFFDTSKLPPYWAANNFGAERSGSGEKTQVTKEQLVKRAGQLLKNVQSITTPKMAMTAAIQEAQRNQAIEGGENNLPARSFLGDPKRNLPAISLAAQAKVTAIFSRWFVGEVEIAKSPLGRVFARHSKRSGGRFAPR